MTDEDLQRMLEAFRYCKIEWLLVVPSTGLDIVYSYYETHHHCLYVTREEEAIAIATGLALGCARPLVLMQQSGVGNCLNAVFTLADAYEVYFPILVCDRSELDPNLVQRTSSKSTKLVLESLGCGNLNWSEPSSINKFGSYLYECRRWIICPH